MSYESMFTLICLCLFCSSKTSTLGYISRENLKELLGKDITEKEIDEIINVADTNGDGQSK